MEVPKLKKEHENFAFSLPLVNDKIYSKLFKDPYFTTILLLQILPVHIMVHQNVQNFLSTAMHQFISFEVSQNLSKSDSKLSRMTWDQPVNTYTTNLFPNATNIFFGLPLVNDKIYYKLFRRSIFHNYFVITDTTTVTSKHNGTSMCFKLPNANKIFSGLVICINS